MCGIAGFINKRKEKLPPVAKQEIDDMLAAIRHRGPDKRELPAEQRRRLLHLPEILRLLYRAPVRAVLMPVKRDVQVIPLHIEIIVIFVVLAVLSVCGHIHHLRHTVKTVKLKRGDIVPQILLHV